MAKARAIVKRLKAVRNIRKITRTMELIATARFKKAMDRATEAAAYTRKISEIVADLSQANLQFSHPLLESRETTERRLLLIITSNRGLCGGYNGGVLRLAMRHIRKVSSEGVLRLEVCGKRGIGYMRFQKMTLAEAFTHFEDKPTFEEVETLADRFIDWFTGGKIDRLDIVYTKFESASRQKAVLETLLPIGEFGGDNEGDGKSAPAASRVEYEFLPAAEDILREIVPAAFKARLFKCFLDAAVSEQISRMVAMKGATENAVDMIGTLSQQHNRARQTQITSELLEIIGGTAALE